MGLDQYAVTASDVVIGTDSYDNGDSFQCIKFVDKKEIAYWRKHQTLNELLGEAWEDEDRPLVTDSLKLPDYIDDNLQSLLNSSDFNCTYFELEEKHIDDIEKQLKAGNLKEYYETRIAKPRFYDADSKFIKEAREELKIGRRVFYYAWW